jgi:hypothetical protein
MDDISSQRAKKMSRVDGTAKSEKYWMRLYYSFGDAQAMQKQHRSGASAATLFSRGKVTRSFFTSDSHRYITALEQDALLFGVRRYERAGQFDSVQMRYSRPTQSPSELLYNTLRERYSSIGETLRYLPDLFSAHISPVRVWNASIIGAIFFGMFSMTLIYRYLGQQVSAESTAALSASTPVVNELSVGSAPAVLGATMDATSDKDTPSTPLSPADALKKSGDAAFAAEVSDMVKGYPIEVMLPYILKQDRDVASFLIGIGKKESNWGKRVPVLNGRDCYNYWGYRGIRDDMGTGGHTCFNSPEDAVNTVAKRIKTLVQEKKLNTPAKMIVWKCGNSCAGHKPADVRKWISDVDIYYQELK